MTNSLDLEHLRTLIAIAECGGFTKAAAARHVSQPALSQHVRLLERGLKRTLFEREGRTMRFTPDGERVLAEARRIVEVHDSALGRLVADPGRTVVVGSTEHAAEQVLPEMLRALSDAFPGATPRFQIARSTQLADEVGRGSVDLAFVLDPDGRGAGSEVATLPLQWYAAPSAVARVATADEVSLVAFEEPCGLRERALATLAGVGLRASVTAQSTTLEGVLAGVRAGLGVALLPSTGGGSHGLDVCDQLPAAGSTALKLLTRRGLDPELETTAFEAGARFFRDRPHLQLVRPAPTSRGA